MIYKVRITDAAIRDIEKAADYIDFILMNSEDAERLVDDTETTIHSLSVAPKAYPYVSDPVLASWSIRFEKIRNYILFFLVDDEQSTVYVVRFLHETQDWCRILLEETDLEI